MSNSTSSDTRLAADLVKGDTILFPVWVGPTVIDQPRTIAYVVEYPQNRVLYFTEGGYGIADRRARIEVPA